jgi:hypothetical protein
MMSMMTTMMSEEFLNRSRIRDSRFRGCSISPVTMAFMN